jgi:single-stranded-DNA-specific exonuclease
MKKPEIKNLKKAATRIIKAAKNKERIIIYADSDLDGVGSAIIFNETLKNIGAEAVEIYFPDRETDGYGITEAALLKFKKHSPALLVSLDCGIGNLKEVDIANEMGFEVIIIDHHQMLEGVPNASIIVDPKQEGDEYPFKEFANVGITYKLAGEILGDKLTGHLKEDLIQFAAIATISDMMPRVDENEEMIMEGLGYLKTTWRPGIRAIYRLLKLDDMSLLEAVYKMNSFLNIRNIGKDKPYSYLLLTTTTQAEAFVIAEELIEKGMEKREKIRKIGDEVRERIGSKSDEVMVFEGDKKWELVLLGVIASNLTSEKEKPVFLYKQSDDASFGSVRSYNPDYGNMVDAMKTCADFLITYGGHPAAAGFRVKNEDLNKFKMCLTDYFEKLKNKKIS